MIIVYDMCNPLAQVAVESNTFVPNHFAVFDFESAHSNTIHR